MCAGLLTQYRVIGAARITASTAASAARSVLVTRSWAAHLLSVRRLWLLSTSAMAVTPASAAFRASCPRSTML